MAAKVRITYICDADSVLRDFWSQAPPTPWTFSRMCPFLNCLAIQEPKEIDMSKFRLIVLSLTCLSAPPALFAQGDVASGAALFNKCRSCHAIVSPEGDVIQKGGRTGPNLYGLVGRQAGTVDGYRYGNSLVEAGEAGLVWDLDRFVAYTADPRAFLREVTGDNAARSKMAFRLQKGGEDVFAYIEDISKD